MMIPFPNRKINRAGSFLVGASISIIVLFATETFARDVEFSWAPMAGAIKYEIQVSKSQKFEVIAAQGATDKPAYSAPIDIGRYYYRVRVIDIKGHPGKWSTLGALLVDPYAPELLTPAAGFETSYYEVAPTIDFTWKTNMRNSAYEILISKSSGEKVLESPSKELKFKTATLPEGEYIWKVRSVANEVTSDYSTSRAFTVIKKPFTAPVLIKPTKDGLSAAYRSVPFEWQKDSHAHFTDVHYEKTESYTSEKKLFSKTEKDLDKDTFMDEYEEPGQYKWWVVTKEAKNTPGLASDSQNFEVRNDVISKGNYELEFSLSPFNDLYTTSSARQTSGTSQISQQSSASSTFIGFLGGYYFFESMGIFLAERTASMSVETFNDTVSETDLQLRLRFGSKGFNQELIAGYRIMDLLEVENSPSSESTSISASGPLIGSRVTVSLSAALKLQGQLFYFKPIGNVEGMSGWVTDVYGGFAAVKWNFMNQFYLGYRFQMERINSSFNTPQKAPNVTSSWTQYRLEPFYLSISFEH